MIFYEVGFKLTCGAKKITRDERTEAAVEIQSCTKKFYESQDENCFIVVANILYQKGRGTLCVAEKKRFLDESMVKKFLRATDLSAEIMFIHEITLGAYKSLLEDSDRKDYIDDAYDIWNMLDLRCVYRELEHRNSCFNEKILSQSHTKKQILETSKRLLFDENFKTEIERIYSVSQNDRFYGHPAHYIISYDSTDAKDKILNLLLTALYQNNRIESRRYTEVTTERAGIGLIKSLYLTSIGGSMVVSLENEDVSGEEFSSHFNQEVIKIGENMLSNRNKVLTIFCINRKDTRLKDALLNNLKSCTMVSISQLSVDSASAKQHLRWLAKQHEVKPTNALYTSLKNDCRYNSHDLKFMFYEWYDKMLRTDIFPQYANLETVNKIIVAQKPKGSAYEELISLIGLNEVKHVIGQALDFHKAQNLFKTKGYTPNQPSMHMVFTGNPGSAKTTVARLFARIMKDNNILSVGELHEVGRADLVGKYVGSTAPKVKEVFESAEGSVLFIDEAYSLVDDRNGLFGDEAITTIVQEMENNRSNIIVIFAGYPDKMEEFLNKNPGLRSRIAFHVPFDDYNADELCDITELMAKNRDVSLGDGVREKLHPIYESAVQNPDFGNGRYARNLFEKAVMRQATRLVNMDVDGITKSDLETLIAEDFEGETIKKQIKLNKIGF